MAVLTCVPILVLVNAKVVVLDSYAKANVVVHVDPAVQVIVKKAVVNFVAGVVELIVLWGAVVCAQLNVVIWCYE